MATVHIESKKEDIADIVLMPGDPNRAKYIAKKFLKKVKLVNTVRGMTAYTGYYKKRKVTIFPSGMGIPSMGIYSYELFNDYDVKRIIRIGSCGAYKEEYNLNDIVLVKDSYSHSNYAKTLNNYEENNIESSIKLNNEIKEVSLKLNLDIKEENIYSSEVFYEQNNDFMQKVTDFNVMGVEMETFALFANAKLLNKEASCLLTVSDSFCFSKQLTSKQREQGLNDMILLALESCLEISE